VRGLKATILVVSGKRIIRELQQTNRRRPTSYYSTIMTSSSNGAANGTAAKNNDPLRPVIFAGPSGVGKGTLIEMLMKQFPNDQFGFSVSHTTRAPRDGEVDGVHYHFTTVENIQNDIKAGKFIEYAEVHGRYYGTRYVEVVRGRGLTNPHAMLVA